MNENIEIQKLSFKKRYVMLEDDVKIELPNWIKNRFSSLRFINETKTLQIQCYKCKNWYDIALFKENKWLDLHQDNELKLHESGFSSYCYKCSTPTEDKDNKDTKSLSSQEDIEKTVEVQPISSMERDTIFLTSENLKYVRLRLALGDMRKADFYNYLVAKEMELNPITKFLK